MIMFRLGFLCLILLSSNGRAAEPNVAARKGGSDWPIFLGPTQNGVSTETGILTQWPKDGLKILWDAPMGMGYAPPVIGKGRLYHFDRFGDKMRLTCRNSESGKLRWRFEYETDYRDLSLAHHANSKSHN